MALAPGSSANHRSPGDAVVAASLELSARAHELLEILDDRFKGDARMLYEGAQRMVSDATNPVRLPLAAAALREIMDELEDEAGFTHQVPDWKERIAKLESAWEVAERSLGAGPNGGASGFAHTLDEFFAGCHRVPKRRDLADRTIGRFDPARREAPPVVREARAAAWMEFRRYFNIVLHREIRPTDTDFRRQLERFEDFLFDWLRPPTFADFDLIDELLQKGPPNG